MKHKTPPARPASGQPAKPYVRTAPDPDEHMTQIRTRVPDAIYEHLVGEAALSGVSLAGLVRDILTAHVGTVEIKSQDGDMTAAEKAEFRAWLNGVTDEPNKKVWRALVDTALRNKGIDLPPLTDEHYALLEWASAVHPYTRTADTGPYPPRYTHPL